MGWQSEVSASWKATGWQAGKWGCKLAVRSASPQDSPRLREPRTSSADASATPCVHRRRRRRRRRRRCRCCPVTAAAALAYSKRRPCGRPEGSKRGGLPLQTRRAFPTSIPRFLRAASALSLPSLLPLCAPDYYHHHYYHHYYHHYRHYDYDYDCDYDVHYYYYYYY